MSDNESVSGLPEAPTNAKCAACGGPATHQAYFADGMSYPACDAPECQPEEAAERREALSAELVQLRAEIERLACQWERFVSAFSDSKVEKTLQGCASELRARVARVTAASEDPPDPWCTRGFNDVCACAKCVPPVSTLDALRDLSAAVDALEGVPLDYRIGRTLELANQVAHAILERNGTRGR